MIKLKTIFKKENLKNKRVSMEIIFIAYKSETKTKYYGKTLRHKDISVVEGISNIKLNTPYYLFGELNGYSNLLSHTWHTLLETISMLATLRATTSFATFSAAGLLISPFIPPNISLDNNAVTLSTR